MYCELNEGEKALTVQAAPQGGYVVSKAPHETLFAGDLESCLLFIKTTIARHVFPQEGCATPYPPGYFANTKWDTTKSPLTI